MTKYLFFIILASCTTTPKIQQQRPKSEGLTNTEVTDVIHSHLSEINECYVAELDVDPELEGTLHSKFFINLDGSVQRLYIDQARSDKFPRSMMMCIKNQVMSWKFPKPRNSDEVTISYPFTFTP